MLQEVSKLRLRAQSESGRHLVPECLVQSDGYGPSVDLIPDYGRLLVLTLDLNHVTERESLLVSVWGSPDGDDWGTRHLVNFRQKYYCGIYSILLNLVNHPEVRYVRGEWKITRSGKTKLSPTFGFSVRAQESGSRISSRFETHGQRGNKAVQEGWVQRRYVGA